MAKRSTAKTKKVMVEPERAVLYSGNVLLLQMERGREGGKWPEENHQTTGAWFLSYKGVMAVECFCPLVSVSISFLVGRSYNLITYYRGIHNLQELLLCFYHFLAFSFIETKERKQKKQPNMWTSTNLSTAHRDTQLPI